MCCCAVKKLLTHSFKAKFHYAIQVADQVCDQVYDQVCDLDSVMEFGLWRLSCAVF